MALTQKRVGLGLGCAILVGGLVTIASCSSKREYASDAAEAGAGGRDDSGGGVSGGGTRGGTGGTSAGGSSVGASDTGGVDAAGGDAMGGDAAGGMDAMGGAGGQATSDCHPGDVQSCWETPDGQPFGTPQPAEAVGSCLLGERKCAEDGTWGQCLGAVAPQAKDSCTPGNDANCNGIPNEECPCTGTEERSCGSDVGNCVKGTQKCADGIWGECVGEVKPAASDSCDATDDANCNDIPHEGCLCVNGAEEICGKNVGACHTGKRTCVNGVYPADCDGDVEPAAKDTCVAGNDANCNGTPNEGCECNSSSPPETCGDDTGACKTGTRTCSSGAWSECVGSIAAVAKDTCFAVNEANDTNCNGTPNEGCGCVASAYPKACSECGTQTCDGATGNVSACVGNNSVRCAGDVKQACASNGKYADAPCPPGTVCRNNGAKCQAVDGQTCLASGDCVSNDCRVYYRDADNDTFGDPDNSAKFCGATPPAGYRTTKTDCCDSDEDVRPDQTDPKPRVTNCGGGDFNCDGAKTLTLPNKAVTNCDLNANTCTYTEGWSNAVGECGDDQYYAWVSSCSWQASLPGSGMEGCGYSIKVEYPGSTTLIQKCL